METGIKRVLVAAPTSKRKNDYNEMWAVYAKNGILYPHDTLVVDNSLDTTYRQVFDRVGVECIHHSPKGKLIFETIADSQNIIRNRFLEGNYDYLLFWEPDLMFPPVDIIERFIAFNVPVVGAMYLIGGTDNKEFMLNHLKIENNVLSNYKNDVYSDFKLVGTGLHQVCSVGFGCTLIHRMVLEKIAFKADKNNASDAYFFNDVAMSGFAVYVDTDTYIPHYNDDWGMILEKHLIL